MGHIFISYVEEDSRVAADLAKLLNDAGLTTWRYEQDSRVGQNYLLQTRQQIESCDIYLIILSPHSLLSNQIELEVVRAHECDKPILPVLVNLTYDEFGQQRPDWQQAMGGATAITLPGDGDVGPVAQRLLDGVQDIVGHLKDREKALRQLRKRRMRPQRLIKLALVPVILLIALVVGVVLYRNSIDAQRVAEARERLSQAQAQFRNQEDDEALTNLNRAIELQSDLWEAYVLRAELLLWMHKPTEALADIDAVLKAQPNHADATWFRGWALRDLERYDEAIATLTHYIDDKLGTREAELERAGLYLQLEQIDKALDDFTLYINRHPDWPQGYVGRAFTLLARVSQRDLEAAADFQKWLTAESVADLHDAAGDCAYVISKVDSTFMPAYAGRGIANLIDGWISLGTSDLRRALDSAQLSADLRERCTRALQLASTLPTVSEFTANTAIDVTWQEMQGVGVHTNFVIKGASKLSCAVEITIADDNGQAFDSRKEEYSTIDAYLGQIGTFTPERDEESMNINVFMPYQEMPCKNGQNYMQYYAQVLCGRARVSETIKGPLLFDYPPKPTIRTQNVPVRRDRGSP